MIHLPSWALGVPLAATIAAVAFRAGSLSASGALAALAAGALVMGAGWTWGVLLIAYFVASAALSAFRARDKQARTGGRLEKGGPRDATQVLANGGVFVAMAVGFWVNPHPLWQALGAGAIAASAADTWATELGTLSPAAPRSVLTWRPVSVGTSGGVTAVGFLAGAAGAAFVALLAAILGWPPGAVISAIVGGVLGCVIDSVIGAAWQARRRCPACGVETEARVHRCGAVTTRAGGAGWLDNDGVNALATLAGALFGAGVATASYP